MSSIPLDLRYALRAVRRHPAFTAVALTLLALGIGANTAIFSVVRAVVLRPLPYEQPHRLLALLGTREGAPTPSGVMSAPDVADYSAQAASLEAAGGVAVGRSNLTQAGDPASILVGRFTDGFFSALRVVPAIGRLPTDDEHRGAAPAVALLSDGMWRRRFSAARDVIGRTFRLDDRPVSVIGVLPSDPLSHPSADIDMWIPLTSDDSRGSRNLTSVARMSDGATIEVVQRDLDVVAGRLAAAYPESNTDRGVRAEPLLDAVAGPTRGVLTLLFAATIAVLLIAAANLGNMLLARASGRRHEFAVRAALGAGRAQLARLLLVESFVLVCAGAVLAVVLAGWIASAFVALSPVPLPRGDEVQIDGVVIAFATALSFVTGLLAGLAPLAHLTSRSLSDALATARARAGRDRMIVRVGDALVVTQVALSCALFVGAVLLLQSFQRLGQVEPGFDVDRQFTFAVNLPGSRYDSPEARLGFYETVEQRLVSLPGVVSVGAASNLPLAGHNLCDDVTLEDGRTLDACAEFRSATPDYFASMGMPLSAGRGFTDSDGRDAPRVAVVNATFARLAWPDAAAIGRRVEILGAAWDVVGVVGDVRHFGPARAVPPEIYAPLRQAALPFLAYAVRTRGDPGTLARSAQEAVWAVDPELPVRELATFDRMMADAMRGERFRALLVGALGVVALALAVLGIYGLLAYLVASRTREIGIRMALGAAAGRVVRGVLAHGVTLAAAGVAIGIGSALMLSRLLRAFLFATEPNDPVVYALAGTVFVLAAATAALVPARRAARIDPMEALRHE